MKTLIGQHLSISDLRYGNDFRALAVAAEEKMSAVIERAAPGLRESGPDCDAPRCAGL